MVRAAAALLIGAGFGCGGLLLLHLQRERVRLLQALLLMLVQMESLLRYGCMPMPELLHSLAENSGLQCLRFLGACAKALQDGQPLGAAWQNGLRADRVMDLLPETASQLLAFGGTLGKTDVQGQLDHCARCAALFQSELERQEAKTQTAAKLYPPLGVLLGIGAAMMIL